MWMQIDVLTDSLSNSMTRVSFLLTRARSRPGARALLYNHGHCVAFAGTSATARGRHGTSRRGEHVSTHDYA